MTTTTQHPAPITLAVVGWDPRGLPFYDTLTDAAEAFDLAAELVNVYGWQAATVTYPHMAEALRAKPVTCIVR